MRRLLALLRRTALLSRPDGSGEPSYATNVLAGIILLALTLAPAAAAQNFRTGQPAVDVGPTAADELQGVGIDQRLGSQVPLDLAFRDEDGRDVRLGDYFRGKPVVLVLAYYRCPSLCNQVLNALVLSLRGQALKIGDDFEVVTVSFDPRDSAEAARAKKASHVEAIERHGQPRAAEAWHFLIGDQSSVDRLTEAVGYRYVYDPKRDQFAHAAGIMVLTPDGQVSRYLFGLRYEPRDLRLGLVEASEGQVGTPVIDAILLYCFHYDAASGRYTASVLNLVRAGGVVTLAGLASFALWSWRRNRARARTVEGGGRG